MTTTATITNNNTWRKSGKSEYTRSDGSTIRRNSEHKIWDLFNPNGTQANIWDRPAYGFTIAGAQVLFDIIDQG